jgi:hypothetical protein
VAKQAGMGDGLWLDGYDVSGDIGSLGRISGSLTTQDTTSINKYANARTGLLRDGGIDWSAFWNPGVEADAAHAVHKTLPSIDRAVTYCRGTLLGSPAASMIGKQLNYDGSRAQDGSLTFGVNGLANGFGLEWGQQLTPGKLTQGAAGNGLGADLGAVPISYSFGWAAYLHVFAFTGTSITIKIQDSADNAAFADVTSATFAAASGISAQRISAGVGSTATVRRYARIVSSGTFTNAVFGVNFVRYEIGGHS